MTHLAEFRKSRNLTRAQFAQLLGVTAGHSHDLEFGRRKPSPSLVFRIESITGISRHDLRPDIYGPPAGSQKQGAAA
jgi:transcriptional regulator with XRE-family HTH domain